MTRNGSEKSARRTRSNGGGPATPQRGRLGRAGAGANPTRDLIRQIIEDVAVPELLRRHGSVPPSRRSRAARAVTPFDLAQLVRLLCDSDGQSATKYVDDVMRSPDASLEMLMLDILPRAADLLEAEVSSGRAATAMGVVGLSKLRMIALRHFGIATVGRQPMPISGRVALLSMVDDAASFDLVPYEYALWTANFEVTNLDGVSPRELMDVLHTTAFDCVLVGCRREELKPALSRWLRAARIVARGRPRFVTVAKSRRAERQPIPGCTTCVYGARDAVAFMSELLAEREQIRDERLSAFQISDLAHYRSKSEHMPDFRRVVRSIQDAGGPEQRVLTRH
jgi:hypothetical protein